MEMRKVVLKLNIHDDRDKKKAIKAVSSIEGIDSISVDMKASKMTIIGDVDPVVITYKLRKQWGAQIVTVGPAKEEKKETKDTKPEKNKPSEDQIAQIVKFYQEHGQPYHPPPYYVHSVNEDPNACTIC